MILVADTFNHKMKVLDPFRNEIFSWLGSMESHQQTLSQLRDGTTS